MRLLAVGKRDRKRPQSTDRKPQFNQSTSYPTALG